MANYCFESPYGIVVTQLRATSSPNTATLVFEHNGAEYGFHCVDPRPLAAITDAFDDCWQIRVVDANESGAQLEFGRFKVELWDEDNPYSDFVVDRFEQLLIAKS